MENINFNIILNGADFQEIKYLCQIIYLSSIKENYNASLSIKSSSNISNYNLTYGLVKIGKFSSRNCSNKLNAIISLDYQSTINYLPFIDNETLILVDYSKFNVCNFFLAENNSIDNKIKEKTNNTVKIPVDEIINLDSMGKHYVSPYISLIGSLAAKSGLLELDSISAVIAGLTKNDMEKKNAIKALIIGYDFINNAV